MNDSMNSKELLQMIRSGKITPEHYGDYWGQDDRQRLKSMFLEGVGLSEIAIRLERSESSVFQQIVCMNLFSDSRTVRTRRKAATECRCSECSAPCGERPAYCPYQNGNA